MKEIVLKSTLRQYRLDELSDGEQILIRKAIEATDNAYVPYSHFHVGAALMLADGTVFIGANQENAAFPLRCVPSVPPFLQPNHSAHRNQ